MAFTQTALCLDILPRSWLTLLSLQISSLTSIPAPDSSGFPYHRPHTRLQLSIPAGILFVHCEMIYFISVSQIQQ